MALTLTKKKDPAGAPAPAVKPFVATPPTVNLLAPEVLEVVALKKVRRNFTVAGSILGAGVVALWALQAGMIATAEESLAAETQRASALQVERTTLRPVGDFYTQVAANRAAIEQTMAKEVLFSTLLTNLDKATPRGVLLNTTGLQVTNGAAPQPGAAAPGFATPCGNPDPYHPSTAVGCVSITGLASGRAVLGDLIENLDANPLFDEVFISATTADPEGEVAFTGTVGLTDAVFTERYLDPDFLQGAAQ